MKILLNVIVLNLFSISLANAEGSGLLLKPSRGGKVDAVLSSFTSLTNGRKAKLPNIDNSRVCSAEPSLRPEGLVRLSDEVASQVNILSCQSSRFNAFARFTTDSCQTALACGQNLENSGLDLKKARKTINELIALDFIKNAMITNSDDMERFHVMKKFAQEKIDPNLGSKCLNRFATKGMSQCEDPLMEKAFEERQNECEYGKACFTKDDEEFDVESYTKFKSKNDDKVGSLMKSYFGYRSDRIIKKKISEDDKRIEDLKKLALNPEYKKAKPEKKIELIVATIGRDKSGRLKDPIIGYDFGSENPESPRQAPKFKEFLKLMDSKTVDKDFDKSFKDYRKNRAEFHLNSENSCSQTKTVISICNQATLIAAGDVSPLDVETAEHYSSSLPNREGVDYEILKGILGPDFKDEDFSSILTARRCILFGFVDESGRPRVPVTKEEVATASTGSFGSGRMNSVEASGQVAIPSSAFESSGKPTTTLVDELGLRNGAIKPNPSGDEASGLAAPKDEISSSDSPFGAPAVGAQPAQGPATNSFTDMFGANNYESFASKVKPKIEDESVRADDSQALKPVVPTAQDKMNDYLMKKLAAAEENLEKLKADTEAADADRAKQKKIDEEAALIKDLKGQIADLKSAKSADRKIASVQDDASKPKAATVNHGGSATISPISSGRAELPVQKIIPSDKHDSATSAAQAAQQSSRGMIGGSGAILSSVSNADGSRTTTLGSGLVVTTIDGLSSEKAQQTISTRIIELNGSPFYIEEGGMVKEIIAVVKDGKILLDEKGNPIFEKIVKGKIGDKKFAAKVKDKKDRAPAAIVDVADLKRDQEEKLKRERAEYLKLKSLTNGALKKK